MNMNHYDYAQLGSNCRTSMQMLTSNHKFFPPNYQRYDWVYTQMARYPAVNNDIFPALGQVNRPEDIKTNQNELPRLESFKNQPKSCCGRK